MSVEMHDPLNPNKHSLALFNLGFRPFFLLAGLFGLLGMLAWTLVYHNILSIGSGGLTLFQWHAHEMIFGYTAAVIAGFLLTSVKNWTGLQTPVGRRLALLVALWLAARLGFVLGGDFLTLGVFFNLSFLIAFSVTVGERIFRVRQWRQAGILIVTVAFVLTELLVLLGLLQRDQWLISKALYGGFYLVLMLILVMGRRLTPFFIERGVGYPCTLRQSALLDGAVLIAFAIYALNALFINIYQLGAAAALVAAVAHGIRLVNWHTRGIWKKPLLWSLYLALVFMEAGFAMAALAPWWQFSPYLLLHWFAIGGIGLVTLSMMARVSLGHTGRDIHNAPRSIAFALVVMVAALLSRVIMPMVAPSEYGLWVLIAQLAWMLAFLIFLATYIPILLKARVDGRPG